jgi:hypothetical protein
MAYLILGSIFIIAVFLIVNYLNQRRLRANIDQIRSSWINQKRESFDFVNIRRYAHLTDVKFHRLTNQTIDDIDFLKLFEFVDRTTSRVGQQFLFKKVIEPTNFLEDPSKKIIHLLSTNSKLREQIQLELLRLNSRNAYYISSLLNDSLPEKPKWFKLLTIELIIMLCLISLSFKFPVLVLVLLVPVMINMALHYWNKNNTFQFAKSVPQLNVLINVSKNLIKKQGLPADSSVKESISNLKSFQRKSGFISFEEQTGLSGELGVVGFIFTEMIKIFFLIEVFFTFEIVKELKDKKSSITTLFDYVGNIDAAISIAALRASSLKTCEPVFTENKKEAFFTNVYHPLIENCTKNSLTINNKGILITGSNMSGKSTFLRTLTINSILAQTIYTCFGDEFSSPILKQFSSIRIADNLFEGKSYYFQEVSTVGSLIAEVRSPYQNLFVLDEVFKGTNTVERIAAAKAILSYLNRDNNIVIVSTHDIELAEMLGDEYDLHHFTETIENNELHFDHRIKAGPVTTRNAIKILELSDYPVDIIREAREISTALKANV